MHARLLACLLAGASAVAGAAGAAAKPLPNIVMILADDLGYGDLSCYPHLEEIQTPNIDKLAASGVRMTQAYASPVCSPTRTALLTGKFAERYGVYGNYDGANPGLGPSRAGFPALLQKAGYRTAWFGKWHQGWDVANHPLNNGFDVAFGFLGGMHDYFDPAEGDHYVGGPFARHAYVFDGIRPARTVGYLTDEITERAVAFMRQSRGQPFFLYLAYNAPHTPLQAPDEAILKYLKAGREPLWAARRAMVDVLDAGVGRLAAALKELGLEQETLVVFMSDNGAEREAYNGGLRGTKMTAWEGGIRVPLIASWPGAIPAGQASDTVCCLPDLAATFTRLAGVTNGVPGGDGVDLLPFWTGARKGHAHENLVWAVSLRGPAGTRPTPDNVDVLGVRMGNWKLVGDKPSGAQALYNLADDLGERRDLSQQNPEKKAELAAFAASYFKECPQSCGLIANRETRGVGDKEKNQSLRRHCEGLLREKKR